jgi:hypothetical protein
VSDYTPPEPEGIFIECGGFSVDSKQLKENIPAAICKLMFRKAFKGSVLLPTNIIFFETLEDAVQCSSIQTYFCN